MIGICYYYFSRRSIPLVNHVMHSAYCHRNLKLCMKCDEPFLTSEYEEHQKTMHSIIFCDACSEKVEAIDLESHKVCSFYVLFFNSGIYIFYII